MSPETASTQAESGGPSFRASLVITMPFQHCSIIRVYFEGQLQVYVSMLVRLSRESLGDELNAKNAEHAKMKRNRIRKT
jgi:hypothetical protein